MHKKYWITGLFALLLGLSGTTAVAFDDVEGDADAGEWEEPAEGEFDEPAEGQEQDPFEAEQDQEIDPWDEEGDDDEDAGW